MVFDAEGTGLDIGFLCAGWKPDLGGVETHTAGLARELIARGHRVHVLCMNGAEGLEPFSTEDSVVGGVSVRRMAYRYHDHRALADLVESKRAEDVIHAWLAEVPCDLVHVHHATGFGLSALRAISDVGRPSAMTLHDYWSLCPRGQMVRVDGEVCRTATPDRCAPCLASTWPHLMPSGAGESRAPGGAALDTDEEAADERTRFAIEMLQRVDRLFTPSARARSVYVRAGFDEAQIRVVENGVDVRGLAEATARFGAERSRDDRVRLGILGTVLPSKGVLECARRALAAEVPELEIHVHGALPSYHGDESYVNELQSLASSEDRLHVHGPFEHDDLPRILAGLDGVAAPSRWEEVYGLTVREARAAGLPVLVSDVGDLAAVAHGGAAGWIVDAEDDAAWTRAITEFATDAEARERRKSHATEPRGDLELALELERAYLELVLEETGRIPELRFAVDGLTRDPAPAREKKRGFFSRLFGR